MRTACYPAALCRCGDSCCPVVALIQRIIAFYRDAETVFQSRFLVAGVSDPLHHGNADLLDDFLRQFALRLTIQPELGHYPVTLFSSTMIPGFQPWNPPVSSRSPTTS